VGRDYIDCATNPLSFFIGLKYSAVALFHQPPPPSRCSCVTSTSRFSLPGLLTHCPIVQHCVSWYELRAEILAFCVCFLSAQVPFSTLTHHSHLAPLFTWGMYSLFAIFLALSSHAPPTSHREHEYRVVNGEHESTNHKFYITFLWFENMSLLSLPRRFFLGCISLHCTMQRAPVCPHAAHHIASLFTWGAYSPLVIFLTLPSHTQPQSQVSRVPGS